MKTILLAVFFLISQQSILFAYVDKPYSVGGAWDFYGYLIFMGLVFIGYLVDKLRKRNTI